MPTFVQILDFIGTFAFAISGIRLASAKRFDWFGAYVVGLATAIGGGTIRDVLLDVTPGWMTDPIYLICTGVALLWVICFGRWLIRLNNTFFIFDSIGLALFTVVGVGKSIALGYTFWGGIIKGSILTSILVEPFEYTFTLKSNLSSGLRAVNVITELPFLSSFMLYSLRGALKLSPLPPP